MDIFESDILVSNIFENWNWNISALNLKQDNIIEIYSKYVWKNIFDSNISKLHLKYIWDVFEI